MKKLPPRPTTQMPASQREHLAAWLREWAIESKLAAMDPAPPEQQPTSGIVRGIPLDQQVTVGEIRLLAPHLLPPAQRPVYVLVLSNWDNDWKLVTPFSKFRKPATPGELATLLDATPWQVLQIWNSRTLPIEVIAESWVADTAPESLLDDAWALFQHVTFGAELPDQLMTRVGPPILHPNDQRIGYQDDEVALLSGLATVAFITAERLSRQKKTKAAMPGGKSIPTKPNWRSGRVRLLLSGLAAMLVGLLSLYQFGIKSARIAQNMAQQDRIIGHGAAGAAALEAVDAHSSVPTEIAGSVEYALKLGPQTNDAVSRASEQFVLDVHAVLAEHEVRELRSKKDLIEWENKWLESSNRPVFQILILEQISPRVFGFVSESNKQESGLVKVMWRWHESKFEKSFPFTSPGDWPGAVVQAQRFIETTIKEAAK